MKITQQEKDFREFMRDNNKTSFVINEHIIEKYNLENNGKKFLKIRDGVLPLKRDYKDLSNDELSTILAYIHVLLLAKDREYDEDDEDDE